MPEGGGKPESLSFMSTLHSGWQVVPARHGGPEEIEEATCSSGAGEGRLTLATYRFHDGRWHQVVHDAGACEDVEVRPPSSAFP